jgi:hypothetical protein
MQSNSGNKKIVKWCDADNVDIGFNPEVQVRPGKKAPQSLTLDFHTSKGWVRIRLEGDVCDRFNELYKQTSVRMKD